MRAQRQSGRGKPRSRSLPSTWTETVLKRIISFEADLADEEVEKIVPSGNVYLAIWAQRGVVELLTDTIKVQDLDGAVHED